MSRDLFLYTCSELISDILHRKAFFNYKWIPRERNSVCDALAKLASTTQMPTIDIIDPAYAHYEEKLLELVSKFM